jgi:hypothetical protein
MTETTIISKTKPKCVIEDFDGRLIITINGTEIDITYSNTGIAVESSHGDEFYVDFAHNEEGV